MSDLQDHLTEVDVFNIEELADVTTENYHLHGLF